MSNGTAANVGQHLTPRRGVHHPAASEAIMNASAIRLRQMFALSTRRGVSLKREGPEPPKTIVLERAKSFRDGHDRRNYIG